MQLMLWIYFLFKGFSKHRVLKGMIQTSDCLLQFSKYSWPEKAWRKD